MTDEEIARFLDQHPEFAPVLELWKDGGFHIIPDDWIIVGMVGFTGPSGRFFRLDEVAAIMPEAGV